MAKVIQLPFTVSTVPQNWVAPQLTAGKLSPLLDRNILPVGPAFLEHVRRSHYGRTFEEHDKFTEAELKHAAELSANGSNGEDDLGVGDESEDEVLLALDPKEWKKQDHYAVLGLSQLRYKATQEQIKIAHRKKVLKHHPDKKAGLAGDSNDDAFFKCIQKALEVLSNPEKRRQYDSVDQYYADLEADTPTQLEAKRSVEKNPNSFFDLFKSVYEREARFSKKEPVPMLGEINSSKEDVEGFYDFWYNFDSWRSFEYLDKEVNEGSDSRDDKRYTEKKNKSERARRKKEDIARVRNLVDMTLAVDPRIKRIRQEEKDAREAKKKKGKQNGPAGKSQAEIEEEKRQAAEDEARKKEEEEKAKADSKKAKAAAANAAKKARRAARAVEGTNEAA